MPKTNDTRVRLDQDLRAVLARLRQGKLRVIMPSAANLFRPMPNAHFHPTPELLIQTGGATDFVCPANQFRLRTHDVCVMPSGVAHAETPVSQRYDVLVCMHARDGLLLHRGKADPTGTTYQGYESTDLRSPLSCQAFHYLEAITEFGEISKEHRKAYVESLLEVFLLTVINELGKQVMPSEPEAFSLVTEVEKLVRTRIGDPALTVARLASDLGYSVPHLSSQFRKERGMTLAAWIVAERIALASTHLTNPRYNIAEVAWMCGFASPAYFIHVFRKHTSLTPRAYRVGLQTNWAVDAPKRKR